MNDVVAVIVNLDGLEKFVMSHVLRELTAMGATAFAPAKMEEHVMLSLVSVTVLRESKENSVKMVVHLVSTR
jgi:hypothetical protein